MKRTKKGFTLPEIVVSLAVTIIVISLVTSLVVIVAKISAKQNYENACQAEYRKASQLVSLYTNTFSTSNYEIESLQENLISATDGQNTYTISFNNETKVLSAQILEHSSGETKIQTLEFKNIVQIKFTKEGKIILTEYFFDNFPKYSNIVTFGD